MKKLLIAGFLAVTTLTFAEWKHVFSTDRYGEQGERNFVANERKDSVSKSLMIVEKCNGLNRIGLGLYIDFSNAHDLSIKIDNHIINVDDSKLDIGNGFIVIENVSNATINRLKNGKNVIFSIKYRDKYLAYKHSLQGFTEAYNKSTDNCGI